MITGVRHYGAFSEGAPDGCSGPESCVVERCMCPGLRLHVCGSVCPAHRCMLQEGGAHRGLLLPCLSLEVVQHVGCTCVLGSLCLMCGRGLRAVGVPEVRAQNQHGLTHSSCEVLARRQGGDGVDSLLAPFPR